MKKFLAILLSVLFVLTMFASCSDKDVSGSENKGSVDMSAEEIIAKTNEAYENIDSYGMDMTVDMQMSMLGQTVDMPMIMTSEMTPEVIYVDMSMDMAALGQSMQAKTYVDLASDPMVQYVYTEGEWAKTAVEEAAAEMYKSEQMQMDLSMYADSLTEATVVEKTVNGVACYEVSGVVDIDFLEILKMVNMEDMTAELEAAGLPENFFEEIFKDVEPFTLVIGVNKETFLIEYCSMDMTQMMNAFMSSMMDMLMEQYSEDMGAFNISVEIPKCVANATYRDYNNISLEIPAEAIENAVEY